MEPQSAALGGQDPPQGIDLFTKYIAATLTYAAAVIAIADKAIHNGRIELAEISTLQRGAITVATLSYVVVLIETRRSNRELTKEKLQCTRVRELANIQIRSALDVLLRPYRLFLKSVVPVDDWDQLDTDAGYVLQVLAEPRARSEFHSIDARADANVYPKCKNWELLAECTRKAQALLGELVAKFSSYLGAEVLEGVETLRADEMAGIRLPDLEVLITANQEMATFTLEHALGGRGDYAAFDTMLGRIRALLDRIETDAKPA